MKGPVSIEDQLTKRGFVQLYFKAASIRHADLSAFFDTHRDGLEDPHTGELVHGDQVEPMIEAASELLDFLQRAATYLHEHDCYRP